MDKKPVSFRCFYGSNYTQHIQPLDLVEIPLWIHAYRYTHPGVTMITVRVCFDTDEPSDGLVEMLGLQDD